MVLNVLICRFQRIHDVAGHEIGMYLTEGQAAIQHLYAANPVPYVP